MSIEDYGIGPGRGNWKKPSRFSGGKGQQPEKA